MQPESKSRPRVAVIGAGYWGKNLIRNFHGLGCLETICESNPVTLARFQADYPGVKQVPGTSQVFEDPSIDAVAVSSPAESHYGLVKQALRAGKHVFVEKPLSLKVEEGGELVGLAKKQGLLLMVGHLLHYHPGDGQAQRASQSGRPGQDPVHLFQPTQPGQDPH
jgi:UDP-2-acetamido-3-amino-2,3-dideoxy-glucuronate N-acetyltransferase